MDARTEDRERPYLVARPRRSAMPIRRRRPMRTTGPLIRNGYFRMPMMTGPVLPGPRVLAFRNVRAD